MSLQARLKFYYVEANFTAPPKSPDDPARVITLYTIDPVKATTHRRTVTGATNFPTGYLYDPSSQQILMATETWSGGQKTG